MVILSFSGGAAEATSLNAVVFNDDQEILTTYIFNISLKYNSHSGIQTPCPCVF